MGSNFVTEYMQDTEPWFIGIFCATTLYGVLSVLYTQSIFALFSQRKKSRWIYFYTAFASIMFSLGTINIVSGIFWFRFTYVGMALDVAAKRCPDVAAGTTGKPRFEPLPLISAVAFFLAIWLQDGLLLFRCFMTWGRNWVIIVFPSLLYITSIGMSIVPLSTTDHMTITDVFWIAANPQRSKTLDLKVFWALSIALNILLTSLIAGRILYLRGIIRKAVGPYHAKVYTSVTAIVVESAALYTVSATLYFIGFLATPNASFATAMQLVLSIIEAITPILIIHRIASGKAFSNRTLTETAGAILTTGLEE